MASPIPTGAPGPVPFKHLKPGDHGDDVKRFQLAMGLPVTGIVDKYTLAIQANYEAKQARMNADVMAYPTGPG